MENMWLVLILIALLIYEFIVLPKMIQANIYKYVKSINGQTISIQKLSTRDSLYLIEYKVDGKYLKNNARCNFFGYIVEWI